MRFPAQSIELLTFALLCSDAVCGAAQQPTPAPSSNAPAPSPSNSMPAKPKKVWTNDDLAPAARESATTAKTKTSSNHSDGNLALARGYKAQLDKLTSQLTDTEKQLDELKRFQAGESIGVAGGRLNRGYSMEPVPEQIQKLEARRQQLAAEIDAIYDEARKRGILPGQLR